MSETRCVCDSFSAGEGGFLLATLRWPNFWVTTQKGNCLFDRKVQQTGGYFFILDQTFSWIKLNPQKTSDPRPNPPNHGRRKKTWAQNQLVNLFFVLEITGPNFCRLLVFLKFFKSVIFIPNFHNKTRP